MKRRTIFAVAVIAVLIVLAIIIVPRLIDNIKYDVSRDESFTSPGGSHMITMRYDYVSRPDLFEGNEPIFEYSGSGFNETASWEIEWLSEDEIALHYYSSNGKIRRDIPCEFIAMTSKNRESFR